MKDLRMWKSDKLNWTSLLRYTFNVEPDDPIIIQLQSNNELKAGYNNMPLIKFYKSYISVDEFPTVKKRAMKYA